MLMNKIPHVKSALMRFLMIGKILSVKSVSISKGKIAMGNLEKHADWLDYKKKISSILNDKPLETTRYNPIVEVHVMKEEWRKMQKEIRKEAGNE